MSNQNLARNEFAHMHSEDGEVTDTRLLVGNDVLLRLWKGGIDPTEWNKWVKDNPDGAVDFGDFPFPQYFNDPEKHLINFKGYDFPGGGVSFRQADFGPCPVDFSGVNFGGGPVDFSGATFKGPVNFSEADFGQGEILFDGTVFVGNASFHNSFSIGPEFVFRNSSFKAKADFSRIRTECGLFELTRVNFDQEVDFSDAVIKPSFALFRGLEFEKAVQFTGATLGSSKAGDGNDEDAPVSFVDSKFHGGTCFANAHFVSDVVFSNLLWNGQLCDFSQVIADGKFEISGTDSRIKVEAFDFAGAAFNGNFILHQLTFLVDSIDFNGCKFRGPLVQCSHSTIVGNCEMNFNQSDFDVDVICFDYLNKGIGVFDFTPDSIAVTRPITFHGASIDSVLKLPTCRCPQSIDLTSAVLALPLDLSNTDIHFEQAISSLPWVKSVDPEDAKRFRHLKQLAYENRDVERALDFYAKEMRASYHHGINGLKLLSLYLYDWTSDYGRSFLRPLACLLLTTVFFAGFYYTEVAAEGSTSWQIMQFSLSNVLPVIPGIREIQDEVAGTLFPFGMANAPGLSLALSLQCVISAGFLFLMGLALRNRFRS